MPPAIRKLKPMFAAFGRRVYDVGAFGNGSKMKYVANLLVAINNVASAEAMVLGMKAGLTPQMIFDLINAGAGNSRVFELRAPMMVKGNYKNATMKIYGLGQGHAGDRRLRPQDQGADAAVQRHQAGLQQGDEERLRRAGHRRGLRRAGEDGAR